MDTQSLLAADAPDSLAVASQICQEELASSLQNGSFSGFEQAFKNLCCELAKHPDQAPPDAPLFAAIAAAGGPQSLQNASKALHIILDRPEAISQGGLETFVESCFEQLMLFNRNAPFLLETLNDALEQTPSNPLRPLLAQERFLSAAQAFAAHSSLALEEILNDFEIRRDGLRPSELVEKYGKYGPANNKANAMKLRDSLVTGCMAPLHALCSLGANIDSVSPKAAANIKYILLNEFVGIRAKNCAIERMREQQTDGQVPAWAQLPNLMRAGSQNYTLEEHVRQALQTFGGTAEDISRFNRLALSYERNILPKLRHAALKAQENGVDGLETVPVESEDFMNALDSAYEAFFAPGQTPDAAYCRAFLNVTIPFYNRIPFGAGMLEAHRARRFEFAKARALSKNWPAAGYAELFAAGMDAELRRFAVLRADDDPKPLQISLDQALRLPDDHLRFYLAAVVPYLTKEDYHSLLLKKAPQANLQLLEDLLSLGEQHGHLPLAGARPPRDEDGEDALALLCCSMPGPVLNGLIKKLMRNGFNPAYENLSGERAVEHLARFQNTDMLDYLDKRLDRITQKPNPKLNNLVARDIAKLPAMLRLDAYRPEVPRTVELMEPQDDEQASVKATDIRNVNAMLDFVQNQDESNAIDFRTQGRGAFHDLLRQIAKLNKKTGRNNDFLNPARKAFAQGQTDEALLMASQELDDLGELAPHMTDKLKTELAMANSQFAKACNACCSDLTAHLSRHAVAAAGHIMAAYAQGAREISEALLNGEFDQAAFLAEAYAKSCSALKTPGASSLRNVAKMTRELEKRRIGYQAIENNARNIIAAKYGPEILKKIFDPQTDSAQATRLAEEALRPEHLPAVWAWISQRNELNQMTLALCIESSEIAEKMLREDNGKIKTFWSSFHQAVHARDFKTASEMLRGLNESLPEGAAKLPAGAPESLPAFMGLTERCMRRLDEHYQNRTLSNMSSIANISMELAYRIYEPDEELVANKGLAKCSEKSALPPSGKDTEALAKDLDALDSDGAFSLDAQLQKLTEQAPYKPEILSNASAAAACAYALDLPAEGSVAFKADGDIAPQFAKFTFENGIYKSQIARAGVVSHMIDGQEVIFVALRGSEFNDEANGYRNALEKTAARFSLLDDYLSIQRHARRFEPLIQSVERYAKKNGAKIVLAGHSLGGSAVETILKEHPSIHYGFVCGSPGTGNFHSNVRHKLDALRYDALLMLHSSLDQKNVFKKGAIRLFLGLYCAAKGIEPSQFAQISEFHKTYLESQNLPNPKIASLEHADDPVVQVGAFAGYNSTVSARIQTQMRKLYPEPPTWRQAKQMARERAANLAARARKAASFENFSRLALDACIRIHLAASGALERKKVIANPSEPRLGAFASLCARSASGIRILRRKSMPISAAAVASWASMAALGLCAPLAWPAAATALAAGFLIADNPSQTSFANACAKACATLKASPRYAMPALRVLGFCLTTGLKAACYITPAILLSERKAREAYLDTVVAKAHHLLYSFDNHKGTEYKRTMSDLASCAGAIQAKERVNRRSINKLRESARKTLNAAIKKCPKNRQDLLGSYKEIRDAIDSLSPERAAWALRACRENEKAELGANVANYLELFCATDPKANLIAADAAGLKARFAPA